MYSVTINKKNQHLLAVDYLIVNDTLIKGSDIIEFDSTGNLEMQFGRIGLYDGPVSRYHDIAVDNEGSIYVGDILGNRIQKFRRKFHIDREVRTSNRRFGNMAGRRIYSQLFVR